MKIEIQKPPGFAKRIWWRITAWSSGLFDRYLFASEKRDPAGDIDFVSEADWAIVEQNPRGARILVWLTACSLLALLLWASLAKVDEVTRGEGKVIPSSQVQIVQSLDGGIVQKILVREGQQVTAGQLLLRIDPTRFVSSLNENQAQSLSLKAKAARLSALASGKPFQLPEEVVKAAPDLASQEELLYRSRVAELDASLGVARQQLSQRSQEMNEVRARRDQAAQSLVLTQRELDATRPLLKSGAVSDVDVLRLERDVARYRGERDAAAAQLPRIQASIAEASRKMQEVELAFRNQASAELSETMGKLASLSEGRVALADRVKLSEVRSPVRGTVKQLLVNTEGGVVQPGKELVQIVPTDDALLLEARILPRDIAFLHPGQKALVKFTAYDFATYGGLDATLEQISADTVTDEKGNAFYLVKVRTKTAFLGDEKRPIIPGMVAEVDILTGKKTILTYLLKPVLRAKATALTER
ncbi:HlyD family type I secretion periplasmic adaptor subunit [Chitiniphilus shinanonensis]